MITVSASGVISGSMRQSMKMPAATMVAAWMRAETGVGPSIASGNQVCRKSCADLPEAPMNKSTPIRSAAFHCVHRNVRLVVASVGTLVKMVSKSVLSTRKNSAKMPSAKPKSPTRLTTKALIAAALAEGFL